MERQSADTWKNFFNQKSINESKLILKEDCYQSKFDQHMGIHKK
jgi:hypothetical protein